MNRSLQLSRLPVAGCGFGEVLVVAAFDDPERGVINCPASPLLAAALAAEREEAGRGPRARLGVPDAATSAGRSPDSGVMFAVSYLDRSGAAGGFALAAHGGDHAGTATAARWAGRWMRAVRSRRLLTDGGAALCWGGQRAAAMTRTAAEDGAAVRVLGHQVADRASLEELRRLGVTWAGDLDTVPDGGQVVFPAHGTSLRARAVAAARGLRVVDATCPLVTGLHADAASYLGRGDLLAVIGRAADAAVAPLLAQAEGTVAVVQTPQDASLLDWPDGDRVSFVIDPAMPAMDAMPVLAALRARFPRLRGHHLEVMCDHGADRHAAISSIAADSELMLIVAGSRQDPDARAAVRAAERSGARPLVVRRLADIGPGPLADVTAVGLTVTLGAPRGLADQVARALSGLGPLTASRRAVRTQREGTAAAPPFTDREEADLPGSGCVPSAR